MKYLSYNELTHYIPYSKSTLQKFVCAKKIPHYKMTGGRVMFEINEIDNWIKSKKIDEL